MTSPPLTYTAQIFIIIVANIAGNLVFEIHGINLLQEILLYYSKTAVYIRIEGIFNRIDGR